jgi:hypothetical protein
MCRRTTRSNHGRRRARAAACELARHHGLAPVGAGTTTGDGSYDVGANATVTASPNRGLRLPQLDGQRHRRQHQHQLHAGDGCESLARGEFRARCCSGQSRRAPRPSQAGTTTGTGMVDDGVECDRRGDRQRRLYLSPTGPKAVLVVSNTASFTFMATADRNLVANFAPMRTATGGGTVADGSSVTVTATPNAGYIFMSWTEGGVPVCGGSFPHTFSATANRTLVAHFQPIGRRAGRIIRGQRSHIASRRRQCHRHGQFRTRSQRHAARFQQRRLRIHPMDRKWYRGQRAEGLHLHGELKPHPHRCLCARLEHRCLRLATARRLRRSRRAQL